MYTDQASLNTGERAFEKSDYATAVNHFLPLANKGNPTAQYYLGRMSHEGKGLPEDNVAAARWSQKAAAQNSPDAETLLGILYAQGQGVKRDDAEAARLFHKAAARGNPVALARLGMCCILGIGVPQDYLSAYMWLELAAAHSSGRDLECNCLARDTVAAPRLTAAQIEQARRLAREWKPQKPVKTELV